LAKELKEKYPKSKEVVRGVLKESGTWPPALC